MDNREQLLNHLEKIETWEKDQTGLWFWEKFGRLPFKLLDKLTPAFIQEKIALLVTEIGNYIQSGGQYLVNEKATVEKIAKATNRPVESIEAIGEIPLDDMITLSESREPHPPN